DNPRCGSAPVVSPNEQFPLTPSRDVPARPNRSLTAMSTNRDTTIRHAGPHAALLMALALLAAACGGSSSSGAVGSSSPSSSASAGAVAYSACIRSHGVPHYPDP